VIKSALCISIGWHLFCMSFFNFTFSPLNNDSSASMSFLGSILKERDVTGSGVAFLPAKGAELDLISVSEFNPQMVFPEIQLSKPLFARSPVHAKISAKLISDAEAEDASMSDSELEQIPDWEKEELKLEIEEP